MFANVLRIVTEIIAYGFVVMVFYVHLDACIRVNKRTKE